MHDLSFAFSAIAPSAPCTFLPLESLFSGPFFACAIGAKLYALVARRDISYSSFFPLARTDLSVPFATGRGSLYMYPGP